MKSRPKSRRKVKRSKHGRKALTKKQLQARAKHAAAGIKRAERRIADTMLRVAYFKLLAREQSEDLAFARARLRQQKSWAASCAKRATAAK